MKNNSQSGFTLFVAIAVTGTLLLIATGIITLAFKQSQVSNAGKESQIAFYAADTGMECALFWDAKNPGGDLSAFSTTTTTVIHCNRDALNTSNQWTVGGSSTSTINAITFLPEAYCATVTVVKGANNSTKIESLGYNTCDTSNPRRVERAVRASY